MTYDWTKSYIVPRANLEVWHQYQVSVSGHHVIFDYSGNNRFVIGNESNSPSLLPNIIGGQPAWYFNGSRDPLSFTGAFTAKHIFVVAAYEDAIFPNDGSNGYKGLLSGISNGAANVLVGNANSDIFFDFLHTQYRKSDVLFASNNQKAPMSNQIAVIEIRNDVGISMDGIQIGQQLGFTNRRWKGYFVEDLIYSVILDDTARSQLYQYFAMRYHLWQKNVAGLNVYPFPHDFDGNSESNPQSVNFYDPPEGDRISEVLNDAKRIMELQFSVADQYEVKAMQKFHSEHYAPAIPYVYRDQRFTPSQDIEGYIDSPYDLDGEGNIFNYSFRFKQK
jgi:hypothetical protein